MGIRERFLKFLENLSGKKKYPVHEDCSFCGARTYLPFRCPHCLKYFCGNHHLPFNHDCAKIQEWKQRPPAPRR